MEKGGWGKEFQDLSEKERIKKLIVEREFAVNLLEKWFEHSEVFQVCYEDILENPEKELVKVLKYLELDVSEKRIKQIVKNNAFKKLSGRRRGAEDKEAFLRKGVSGDWQNYFDIETIALFKTAINGRWNELVVKMGYEKIVDW